VLCDSAGLPKLGTVVSGDLPTASFRLASSPVSRSSAASCGL